MCDNSRNSCRTCERKSFQMNHIWCKYFLNSLQGQLDEVHFLILDLKSPSDADCLISRGVKLQIFGPKWDRVSVPL